MSPQHVGVLAPPRYLTVETKRRVLDVVHLHGGRATLEQIKAERVVSSAIVTEVLRALISSKTLMLEGDSTYVVVNPLAAESRQLADTGASGTDPKRQPELTAVKSAPVSAEPRRPHPKGARKDGDGHADPTQKRCARCRQLFPKQDFAAPKGRRAFRLCPTCRKADQLHMAADKLGASRTVPGSDGPGVIYGNSCRVPDLIGSAAALGKEEIRLNGVPEGKPPTFASIVEKVTTGGRMFIDLKYLPVTQRYLEALVRTGLWGESIADAAERLIHHGILEQIARGFLTLEKDPHDRDG